jgi:hypothetical protein
MSRLEILSFAGMYLLFLTMPMYDSNHTFSYIQSESSSEMLVKKYNINQTTDDNCDFLNLCKHENKVNLDGISDSFNKGIVDISYLKIDIDLPFP